MATSDVDKGWAWFIIPSTFIMAFLTMGFVWGGSGAYNVIFLKAFPETTAATVAWATSLTAGVSFLIAPVGSVLVSRYGLRFPALIAGIVSGSGFIISYFAPSVEFLIFSFGILTGVGLGIGHIAGNSALTHYFDKHLGLATGLALSGTGVGTFVSAPLITSLDHTFGWRGSLLIVGGITLNICVCGFLNRKNNRVQLRKGRQSFIDWGLFRIFGYQLLVVNCTCVAFGICIVFVHLMAFATSHGYTDTESAMMMSAIGITNLIARFTLPPLTKFSWVNVCAFYSVCYILTGVVACLFPLFGYSYVVLVILSAGFGFFSVSYGALMTLLVVEIVGVDRFASGYGYLVLFNGLGHTCGGPTAGFLFDITGTYDIPLFAGGGMIILGGVIPLFSLCFFKQRPQPVIEVNDITTEEKIPLPPSGSPIT